VSCIPTGSAARAENGATASAEAPAKVCDKICRRVMRVMLSFLCHLPRVFHGASRSKCASDAGTFIRNTRFALGLYSSRWAGGEAQATERRQKTVRGVQRLGIAG